MIDKYEEVYLEDRSVRGRDQPEGKKSKRRQLLDKWMAGFKPYTGQSIAKLWTDDGVAEFPRSPPITPWTKEMMISFESQWENIAHNGYFDIIEYLEDDQDRAVMCFYLTFDFMDDLDIKPYVGCYTMIYHFDRAHERITKFVEVADYGNTTNLLRKVQEGRKKRGLGPLVFPFDADMESLKDKITVHE